MLQWSVLNAEINAGQILLQRFMRTGRVEPGVEQCQLPVISENIGVHMPQAVRHTQSDTIEIFLNFTDHISTL
jgi:hypothetical protein